MTFNLAGLGSAEDEFRVLSAPSGGLCAALSDVRVLFSRHAVSASTLDECIGSISLQDKNAVDLAEFSELTALLRLLASVQSEGCEPELQPMTHAERDSYANTFATADQDGDGLVSAKDVHGIFVASGLGKAVLNHIWSLADSHRTRRLDCQACCVALHLLESAKRGAALPTQLAAEACLPVEVSPEPPRGAQFLSDSAASSECSSSSNSAATSVGSTPCMQREMEHELADFFEGEPSSTAPTAHHSVRWCVGQLLDEQAVLGGCSAQLRVTAQALSSLCSIVDHEVRLGGAGASELAELSSQLQLEGQLHEASAAHGLSSRQHLDALDELARSSEARMNQLCEGAKKQHTLVEQHSALLGGAQKQMSSMSTQLEQLGRSLFVLGEELHKSAARRAKRLPEEPSQAAGPELLAELAQAGAIAKKLASTCAGAGAEASSWLVDMGQLHTELRSVGSACVAQREGLGREREASKTMIDQTIQRTQDKAVAATDDVRMIQTQLKLIQLQQSDLLHRQHSLLAQQLACLKQRQAADGLVVHRLAATGTALRQCDPVCVPELHTQPLELVSALLSTAQALASSQPSAPPENSNREQQYGDRRALQHNIAWERQQPAWEEARKALQADFQELKAKLLQWVLDNPNAKQAGTGLAMAQHRGHHRRGSSITSDLEQAGASARA
eukprot:TRINITY_DN16452_c0_g1_i2.p1 TRINITY_DN16452_c0_g1~~TRINITY_DN16452_c0_g1_i2.p1  ORF type:complete len:675 (+),score=241.07 TRINITY_DN16452_c0_g1_i2:134-2158(+)